MPALVRASIISVVHEQKLLKSYRALAAKRASLSFTIWRHRLRRARSAHAILSRTTSPRRRRLVYGLASFPSIRPLSRSPPSTPCRPRHHRPFHTLRSMASESHVHRPYSVAEPDATESASALAATSTPVHTPSPSLSRTTTLPWTPQDTPADHESSRPIPIQTPVRNLPQYFDLLHSPIYREIETPIGSMSDFGSDVMGPPPPPSADDGVHTRPSRSGSASSRNTNRLSLTLPIALPTSEPTRPARTSSVTSSFPSTPVDPFRSTVPVDTNEFIVAIAAQDRLVLELREELVRAEADLARLKKQWATHEARKNRVEVRRPHPSRPVSLQLDTRATVGPEEELAARRSVEVDRRKMLLQQQSAPRESRRRVIRGGHTRTLSLLSPTKSEVSFGSFDDRDDSSQCSATESTAKTQDAPPTAALSKRASWQPRLYQSPATGGMTQIVEDLRLGLKTFVEDIRQITVGDEPIVGPSPRSAGAEGLRRARTYAEDQDTIRPTREGRPKVAAAFDPPTPEATISKTEASGAAGQDTEADAATSTQPQTFSWSSPSLNVLDDDTWSNWDPVSSVKSTRWSGSTMHEDEADAALESQGVDTPLKKKSPPLTIRSPTSLSSPKLESILPQVVNRLSPSNIKKTANDLMSQWEKSLAEGIEIKPGEPACENKENVRA